MLGDFAADVSLGPAWRGILFRRTYDELRELIDRAKLMYPACWPGALWRETDKEWRFPTGAVLRMAYLERDDDAMRYQGHQYTWIGFDELGQWASPRGFLMLLACLRSAAGVRFKRLRASANPGGPGHQWVKARFIDPAPPMTPFRDGATGMTRMFIPSKVQDNRILLAHDPGYIARLRGVGSDALVKAWLDGDWDVVEGAYFDCWRSDRHVIEPFTIPEHWLRFRSFDWGSAKPFSVGWWAVSDGGHGIPAGALVRYREWYGAKAANVGLKLTAEEVARGILERQASGEEALIRYGVADPAIFAEDGGPSIAERMGRAGVWWQQADNKRVPARGQLGGWDQVRSRLVGEDGRPMLYVFSTCRDLIRTLPALQHDQARPEDVDTDGEDHAPDEARYACMSRPWTQRAPAPPPPRDSWDQAFNREDEGESWRV